MEQSLSREAYIRSAGQHTLHLSWNLKIHYSVHNTESYRNLSQTNQVHKLIFCFYKIFF
jgi:hypothetical protein